MNTSINFDPVSAAANLGSGLLTQLFYKKNLNRQTEAQKELMDKQVQSQKDLYDYQMIDQRGWNEYDEQLGKMYNAGINPLSSDGSYAGAGSASIGSAGLGSPGSMVAPEFNLVDSILNALKSQEVKMQQKATDKDVQKKDEEIANLIAERDNKNADTDLKKKTIEQLNAHIFNEAAETRNHIQQTGILLLRYGLEKSQFEWQKWNSDRNFNQAERGLAIQDYNARTQRFNVGIAEKTLSFQERKWNEEYDLSYKKTMNDIRQGSLDSITKFIDSHRSFGLSGQAIYKLAGCLDGLTSFLRNDKNLSDFDKIKYAQDKSLELVENLRNVSAFDSNLSRFNKDSKFVPKSIKNFLSQP